MKNIGLIILAAAFVLSAEAQSSHDCKCCTEMGLQFNFLVGDWEVLDTADHVISTSSVDAMHDNCVIQENWKLNNHASSGILTCHVVDIYNQWKCLWLDNIGSEIELNAEWGDTTMYLGTEPIPNQYGVEVTTQILYTPQEDGTISYVWRNSMEDVDKLEDPKWHIVFEGTYRPAPVEVEDEAEEAGPAAEGEGTAKPVESMDIKDKSKKKPRKRD